MTDSDARRDDRREQHERLSVEWQLWIVENLLAEAPIDEVLAALADAGVPRALAEEHVALTLRSEAFARLRMERQRRLLTERAFALLRADEVAVPARDEITREDFYRDHFAPMRPLHLRSQLRALRAFDRWDFSFLQERFGSLSVAVTAHREAASRPSQVESRSESVSFGALLDRAQRGRGNDQYLVARNGLLHQREFSAMREDLAPFPDFMTKVPALGPPGVSLWIGPAETHTPLHFDPHAALLVQLRGRKRVRMIPPTEAHLYALAEGYFCGLHLDDPRLREREEFDPSRVIEVELCAGEALFLPVLWWHDVIALEPSIMLSCLNFAWPNDYHAIHPSVHDHC